jgi:hypothetical protein
VISSWSLFRRGTWDSPPIIPRKSGRYVLPRDNSVRSCLGCIPKKAKLDEFLSGVNSVNQSHSVHCSPNRAILVVSQGISDRGLPRPNSQVSLSKSMLETIHGRLQGLMWKQSVYQLLLPTNSSPDLWCCIK